MLCDFLDDFSLILVVVDVGVEGVKVENVAERKKWRERENDWVTRIQHPLSIPGTPGIATINDVSQRDQDVTAPGFLAIRSLASFPSTSRTIPLGL